MKDESKAMWPEGMEKSQNVDPYEDIALELVDPKDLTVQVAIYGNTDDEENARARQICALPQMVALLKEMSELDDLNRINLGSLKVSIDAILREIGEVE